MIRDLDHAPVDAARPEELLKRTVKTLELDTDVLIYMEKQATLPAYFKGGTALYKAQKSIRRFSEAIDLTICIDNCSGSQASGNCDQKISLAAQDFQKGTGR